MEAEVGCRVRMDMLVYYVSVSVRRCFSFLCMGIRLIYFISPCACCSLGLNLTKKARVLSSPYHRKYSYRPNCIACLTKPSCITSTMWYTPPSVSAITIANLSIRAMYVAVT